MKILKRILPLVLVLFLVIGILPLSNAFGAEAKSNVTVSGELSGETAGRAVLEDVEEEGTTPDFAVTPDGNFAILDGVVLSELPDSDDKYAIMPLAAAAVPGGRVGTLGTTYGGAGSFFEVGYEGGGWTGFNINSHSVKLDGVFYPAYCIHPFFTGPNEEDGTESEPDFGSQANSSAVKLGIQAILDHGYPTVDGGRNWERYCTAFAISKWLAMNETLRSDPTYIPWTNFHYTQEQYDYVNSLISYASSGAVVDNGLVATYFASAFWDHQTLVINLAPQGTKINLNKSSAKPALTNGNSAYSLQGAVYGIYRNPACTDLVERLTTDAGGNSTSVELYSPGTYYMKEISPSSGYLLDPRIYTIVVGSNLNVTYS